MTIHSGFGPQSSWSSYKAVSLPYPLWAEEAECTDAVLVCQ